MMLNVKTTMSTTNLTLPNLEDIIYTAGLFDGEGSISLAVHHGEKTKTGRPSNAPMLLIQLSNTDEQIIKWLIQTWQIGFILVSYRPKRPTHRTAYSWKVYGAKAEWVLTALSPYLKIKKPQAMLALESRKLIKPKGVKIGDAEMAVRMDYRDRIMKMNGRIRHPKKIQGIG
jgi:hypothetical protein